MSDVLKKPVHVAILRETHIQKLAREGKLPTGPATLSSPEQEALPRETKTKPGLVSKELMRTGSDIKKQWSLRAKLRVFHDAIPPITKENQPPCHTCKAAPCCKAFVVGLTELEYASGVYGEYAVELTPEIKEQLTGMALLPVALGGPDIGGPGTSYYLEGKSGIPCHFLDANNRCTIYDNRPMVCRTYTCVKDARITQDMRDGKTPADAWYKDK